VARVLRKAKRYAGISTYHHGIEAAIKEHAERVAAMGKSAPPLDLSKVTTVELSVYPPLITLEGARLIAAHLARNKSKEVGRPSRKYLLRWSIASTRNAGTMDYQPLPWQREARLLLRQRQSVWHIP
jgi:hypothetical protein